MDDLVRKLSAGKHPVLIQMAESESLSDLAYDLAKGYCHISFPDTQGGTELKIPVDAGASEFSRERILEGHASIHLEGDLSLNFEKVRFIGDFSVPGLTGEGCLQVIGAPAENA